MPTGRRTTTTTPGLGDAHLQRSHREQLHPQLSARKRLRGPLPGGVDVADLGVNIWQPAFKQINQIAAIGLLQHRRQSAGLLPQGQLHADRRHPSSCSAPQHRRSATTARSQDRRQQPLPPARQLHLQRQHHRRRRSPASCSVISMNFPGIRPVLQRPRHFYGAYVQDSWKATRI